MTIEELARTYWDDYLDRHPVEATAIGDRRHDDRLADASPQARDRHLARLRSLRERVEQVDAAALDPTDAVTHAALVDRIVTDEAETDAWLEAWSVDPLGGPHLAAMDLEDLHAVLTPEHADTMVARWRALGPWFDQHAANLRSALGEGRVAVRAPVEKVVDQLEGILARPDGELPLSAPARREHPDWPPERLARFRADLTAAVGEIVRPALARYLTVLREEILPAARPDDEPGVGRLAGGEETYRRLIRAHTSLDLGAAEIHAVGLEEVARIDDELRALGGRLFGAADLAAVQRRLRGDPALHFSTRREVFDTAAASLARAREAIPGWFGILPRADCVVTTMSEHEEQHSTIAFYRQPAADGTRPGQYFINTWAPETRPRYEAEALAFHEAIPGHHLQIAIAQELDGIPDFRRHLGSTAYVEGWGLYTERLSDEMGMYSGDIDRVGVLSFDAWRACRLVVDTGLHALGWTRQEAIDFMVAHSALAENNVVNEVDRYIVWPGQALAYKLGQLELLRLRAEARATLGTAFDIRAFHDAVLGQGALGLQALGAVVRRTLGPA